MRFKFDKFTTVTGRTVCGNPNLLHQNTKKIARRFSMFKNEDSELGNSKKLDVTMCDNGYKLGYDFLGYDKCKCVTNALSSGCSKSQYDLCHKLWVKIKKDKQSDVNVKDVEKYHRKF